jgi:hypothetical protein
VLFHSPISVCKNTNFFDNRKLFFAPREPRCQKRHLQQPHNKHLAKVWNDSKKSNGAQPTKNILSGVHNLLLLQNYWQTARQAL